MVPLYCYHCLVCNTSYIHRYILHSTQHTWQSTALQLVQQLHMAKQATYATTHSRPFALAQHTSTGTALHFDWHTWQNKLHIRQHTAHHLQWHSTLQLIRHCTSTCTAIAQATHASTHSTLFALAQHTSTGTALHFNCHSMCIWQNKLHMQQHTAHHLHWHSTLQLVRHCTSTGTAIAYGKTSYICNSTQHTICIGTAHFDWHFNWHSNCIWQNKLHMQQHTAHHLHWHSTFQLGTALHFNWHSNCIWQNNM